MPRRKGNTGQSKGSAKQKPPQKNASGSKGGGFGDVIQPSPRTGKRKK